MKYITLLPFMEREELRELAFNVLNGEVKGVSLVTLYPFLDNETLDEIVTVIIEKKEGYKLTTLLPFISQESIDRIYQGIKDSSITGIDETYLLPFLGKSKIKEIFKDLVKAAHDKASEQEKSEEK